MNGSILPPATALVQPAGCIVIQPRGTDAKYPSGAIEVRRYVKPDGWVSRYWAVYIGRELLAVVVYKKGAQAPSCGRSSQA